MDSLKADDAVFQEQLDEATTRLPIVEAKIERIHAEIAEYKALVAQTNSQIAQTRSQIEQARAKVKQAEARVNQTAANLNYGVVKASFAGIVTIKHTDIGAIAGTGAPIVTIKSDRHSEFVAQLPVSLADRVRLEEEIDVYLSTAIGLPLMQGINGEMNY